MGTDQAIVPNEREQRRKLSAARSRERHKGHDVEVYLAWKWYGMIPPGAVTITFPGPGTHPLDTS